MYYGIFFLNKVCIKRIILEMKWDLYKKKK